MNRDISPGESLAVFKEAAQSMMIQLQNNKKRVEQSNARNEKW